MSEQTEEELIEETAEAGVALTKCLIKMGYDSGDVMIALAKLFLELELLGKVEEKA